MINLFVIFSMALQWAPINWWCYEVPRLDVEQNLRWELLCGTRVVNVFYPEDPKRLLRQTVVEDMNSIKTVKSQLNSAFYLNTYFSQGKIYNFKD